MHGTCRYHVPYYDELMLARDDEEIRSYHRSALKIKVATRSTS